MKIENKNYLFFIAIIAILAVAVAVPLLLNKKGSNQEVTTSPSASPSLSATPELGIKSVSSASPSPGVNILEGSYQDWFNQLDPQGRVLGLRPGCSSVVPSNVTYKNNTLIMIDNTYTSDALTLKIGDRSYDLAPHAWHLTTLYSAKLPIDLTISCGGIELGSVRLEK